jgi:hypothetical protein
MKQEQPKLKKDKNKSMQEKGFEPIITGKITGKKYGFLLLVSFLQ